MPAIGSTIGPGGPEPGGDSSRPQVRANEIVAEGELRQAGRAVRHAGGHRHGCLIGRGSTDNGGGWKTAAHAATSALLPAAATAEIV